VPSSSVYIGIDVACAIGKRLPICVVSTGHPLMPLTIPKHLAGLIPRGVGNKEITAAAPFQEAAHGVVSTINRIVGEMGWQVERIAVDAPASPPATGSRASENELGRLGLSSFQTPAASAWVGIREKCANHLRLGGSAATLPHANKIWMRFGFELFASLKSGLGAEVIEVCLCSPSSAHCYRRASTSRRSRGTETSSMRLLPAQGGNHRTLKRG
jgi:hypothetical protein